MVVKRCVRCGVALPSYNPVIDSMGFIDDMALWEANAGKWCAGCQEAFIESMRDYDDRIRHVVEAQDGTPREISRYGHAISGLASHHIGYKKRREAHEDHNRPGRPERNGGPASGGC